MKILNAEFVISAVGPKQYPTDGLPEIALTGRSNVGKSSLINRMIQRKNLARTSSQPGKTQTLNYYRIIPETEPFYFVDFPGYGFAKVSKTKREEWGRMAEGYLLHREPLKLVIQVIDSRHRPSEEDRLMNDWLNYHEIPRCIVLTKIDKVPVTKRKKLVQSIIDALPYSETVKVISFSSETGSGRDELWKQLNQVTNLSSKK